MSVAAYNDDVQREREDMENEVVAEICDALRGVGYMVERRGGHLPVLEVTDRHTNGCVQVQFAWRILPKVDDE